MEYLILIIIWAVISGFIGAAIGDLGGKGNGSAGMVLGALLGPIGWIIAAVMPAAETSQNGEPRPAKPETDQERIARLESELAKLSAGAKSQRPKAKDDLAPDGEIPTYKL